MINTFSLGFPYRCIRPNRLTLTLVDAIFPHTTLKRIELHTGAWVVVAELFLVCSADTLLSAVERSNTVAGTHSNAASTRGIAAAPQAPVLPHTVD